MTDVAIADLCQVNPKHKDPPTAGEMVAFVGMADLDDVTAIARDAERRQYEDVAKGYKHFEDGDILMAKITPCFENRKIGQARTSTKLAAGSTEFHVLRPRADTLDGRYLLHFLRQDWILELGELRMTGSGGQRRVPQRITEEIKIPLPPLEEQRRIAAILDAADELRAKRRQALAKLDTLTQAIFIDMFGDPLTNPMSWPLRPLGDLAEKFSDGPFGSNLKSSHYVDSGIRVIRLQNIGVDRFVDEDRSFISTEHFKTLAKHECRPGDLLVGTLGDPNLRVCAQPSHITVAVNKADCVQVRVDETEANREWMCALLNCPATELSAQSLVKGQTRARIAMGRLRKLKVPVPPIERQQEFAERKELVDSAITNHRQAIRGLDTLFASLQQRAFRGEL